MYIFFFFLGVLHQPGFRATLPDAVSLNSAVAGNGPAWRETLGNLRRSRNTKEKSKEFGPQKPRGKSLVLKTHVCSTCCRISKVGLNMVQLANIGMVTYFNMITMWLGFRQVILILIALDYNFHVEPNHSWSIVYCICDIYTLVDKSGSYSHQNKGALWIRRGLDQTVGAFFGIFVILKYFLFFFFKF